jgi:hypothetical protein
LGDLTVAARRYGWHGTLIAPFQLAPGITPNHVLEAVRDWAARQRALSLPVEAELLDRFVALRAASASGDATLRAYATDALQTLERENLVHDWAGQAST